MSEQKALTLDDVPYETLSPMMKQYVDTKRSIGDTILFYRVGDFYEMFFDDAVFVSRELELTLTGKDCGEGRRAPMCGVPHHAYVSYANRLLNLGCKVAICDQLEDPALAKGLVKRGIIQVLTPGTVTDSNGLDDKKNNFLMGIMCVGSQFGCAVADITTGDFEATQLVFLENGEHLINLVAKYLPSEILYNPSFTRTPEYQAISKGFHCAFTERSETEFDPDRIRRDANLLIEGDDKFSDDELLMSAAGAVLRYADETQTTKVSHMDHMRIFKVSETMELDHATRTNLELTSTIRSNSKKGSLLWAIDRTKTAMGGRLIRKWVEEPLIIKSEIVSRQDAVEELFNDFIGRQEIIEGLTGLHDIERLATKASLGTSNARDLLSLKNALGKLPFLCEQVKHYSKGAFKSISQMIEPMTDVYELLEASINEDPPITIKDGDIIKKGYSQECDELKELATNAKSYIMAIETRERERTGIKNLKIGYNKVFGYYLDVTRSYADLVPEDYIRKQTLTGSERYITPELKELEDKIVSAQTRKVSMEYELFVEIREKVAAQKERLFNCARAVALLDVISAFAELASSESYVKPVVDDSDVIEITGGRHPVVEKTIDAGSSFIPNDTVLDDDKRLMILTGPNMAGKSTYMRQVALIVLMAQIGSFVPASKARIGLVDKIFTRIGASDDISTGKSTFMVEMSEVSSILRNSTKRSLLLLDEVGRGTSTYDGLSIAWAIIEYINDKNVLFARTIFATHYHELNSLEKMKPGIFNMHVEVKENSDGVVFMHKISDGGTSDSYGIEVAKLAGLPEDVLKRSRTILKELERIGSLKVVGDEEATMIESKIEKGDSVFSPEEVEFRRQDKIRAAVRDIDISRLTPLEAMNILYSLTEMVHKEDSNEQN